MGEEMATSSQEREELLLLMGAGLRGPALGSVWRITAKRSDFYLDVGPKGVMHLSVHGPGKKFSSHRFHMKIDQRHGQLPTASEIDGHLVLHGLPPKGQPFSGKQVEEQAWLVARIRWPWHLQERKYRTAAVHRGAIPEPDSSFQSAGAMRLPLKVGWAWDVDLFVSYDEPYWPPLEPGRHAVGGATHLGPLGNDSGMWLTGISEHRSVDATPVPEGIEVPLPRAHERASTIIGGRLDPTEHFYWFTETITSRELIESSRPDQSSSSSL